MFTKMNKKEMTVILSATPDWVIIKKSKVPGTPAEVCITSPDVVEQKVFNIYMVNNCRKFIQGEYEKKDIGENNKYYNLLLKQMLAVKTINSK